MVLVVEDEAVSRRALQSLLRLHGYQVEAVPSAEDGLGWIVKEQNPDVVAIVDVNLPGMSGVEFVRRARRLLPEMPCVFMSANEEVNLEAIRQAFHQPALRKPFELSCLLGLIGEAPSSNPAPIKPV